MRGAESLVSTQWHICMQSGAGLWGAGLFSLWAQFRLVLHVWGKEQDRVAKGAFYGATTVGYCPTRILGLGHTDEPEDIS